MKVFKIKYCEKCGKPIPKYYTQSVTQYNKRLFCNHECAGNDRGTGICVICGKKYQYSRQKRGCVCHHCESSEKILCKCGCGNIIMNPDNRGRRRLYIYGHQGSGNRGRVQSKEEVNKRLKSMMAHFREKNPTCLEKELYGFLNRSNINYEPQKQFGRTIVDAFIPNLNLAIYADGNYWHDKPEIKERDERNNKRLCDRGLDVLRLRSIDNGYHLDLVPLETLIGN
jgi:very-short-patch-repair endonuclease